MEVSASDVCIEGLGGIGALELNTQHCDETQRKIHERDRLRIQYEQKKKPTSELRSPESYYLSIKTYMKHIRFAVMCSVPGYKESCTSVFTEESRLTGDFCLSIFGIVTTPAVGSRATARFDAIDIISGCRTRLRESRLAPDG